MTFIQGYLKTGKIGKFSQNFPIFPYFLISFPQYKLSCATHLSKPQFKVCHVEPSPKPIVYIVEMRHLTEVPFVMKLHAHLTAARAASWAHPINMGEDMLLK